MDFVFRETMNMFSLKVNFFSSKMKMNKNCPSLSATSYVSISRLTQAKRSVYVYIKTCILKIDMQCLLSVYFLNVCRQNVCALEMYFYFCSILWDGVENVFKIFISVECNSIQFFIRAGDAFKPLKHLIACVSLALKFTI